MTTRPYRVGMARPAQRYIEPDEIYTEMVRGSPTRIPARFPFTWNPVNGLGSLEVNGFVDDLIHAGQGIVDDTTQAAKDQGKQAVLNSLNNTPAGRAFLQTVQDQAQQGVVKVVAAQAPNLIVLAVAAGVVGGAIASKTGKLGTGLALAVGVFAGIRLLSGK